MDERNPTGRFSGRAEHYARARPGYPQEAFDLLVRDCSLKSDSVIVDVGSGTGISAEPFLKLGFRVIGVEPNQEMRSVAAEALGKHQGFTSAAGTAEATGLPAASADLVVAAQAFHWFDKERAKEEFVRVLRSGGWAALLWNDRKTEETLFLREYESLLRRLGTDYSKVCHRNLDETAFERFFAPSGFRLERFGNAQSLDWEGLVARNLSSSFVPAEGTSGHEEMMRALREVFDAFAEDGRVTIEYSTRVYYGRLRPA